MGVSFYKIKRWTKMLLGRSIFHVKQNEGKNYSFSVVSGYYNDLTKKVTEDKQHSFDIEPFMIFEDNKYYYFPTAIFQYGLGAYDLYLSSQNEETKELMRKKVVSHANWAVQNQNENGSWNIFNESFPESPFGAMGQGEGASLLFRAYHLTNDFLYFKKAIKAIEFMLIPLECGGTTKYNRDDILFYEFTCQPVVFNGWIFAMFGILDAFIETKENKYENILTKTISTFCDNLKKMDCGYWSLYSLDGKIASPFYHNLHIALLKVLYKYTRIEMINDTCNRFIKYQRNPFFRARAFFVKAWQKIKSND